MMDEIDRQIEKFQEENEQRNATHNIIGSTLAPDTDFTDRWSFLINSPKVLIIVTSATVFLIGFAIFAFAVWGV
jgi:hypothetical protein